ncbi:NADPH:quinone oxidoreductase family protein [Gordonia polyisoprenivorans]|uniref:NADPH:quinone oxidoreductase family protein n=1 Tax=Gordonia polyisoprenivorans TaxID=84595 RepID=UPI001AD75611|nr:NADPH:quinone oxidoreductase family protein [Gordonia polyisoprenivorans]QTI69054.1 NADPH:quinone oxidoreductase family protein [Gordonia polyisoprenivorans]
MRAVVAESLSGPDGLSVVDWPAPRDRALVQIRIGAAGINYPDWLAMRGEYQSKFTPPYIPGCEVAGTVVSAPPMSNWAPGDRVVALCSNGGGYAEQVEVPEYMVAAAPSQLDDAHAVALVANHQTAFFAMTIRARLQPGDTVAVLGGAGGLGSAAIQVANFTGARVIGLVHRAGADDFVRECGASDVVALEPGWADAVRGLTSGRGVDMVVDPVGGQWFDDAIRILAPCGRLVVLGFAAGAIPTVKVNRLLLRNIDVIGVGWGAFLETAPAMLVEVAAGINNLVAQGLCPPVTGRFPFERAREALQSLADGRIRGKVVLEP